MRNVVIIGMLVVAVGLSALISSRETGTSSVTRNRSEGRTIWLRDCAVCHGADAGGGQGGPDIRNRGSAAAHFMVTTGRMPLPSPSAEVERRTSPYSVAQQKALIRYASTLVTGTPIPEVDTADADLSIGGARFRQTCATCHMDTGSGGALPYGKNAPPLQQATPTQVVEAMRMGPGSMPKFGTQSVSKAEADQIAAYVQYLQHPEDPGGIDLGHLGPVPEGLIAWVFGLGAMILITRLLGRLHGSR